MVTETFTTSVYYSFSPERSMGAGKSIASEEETLEWFLQA